MTTQEMVDNAKCIFTCVPDGMQGAVLIALLNQIATAGIGGGLAGAGSPEGVVTANPGATYLNTTDESFWAKKTGAGNTGWIELIA